MAQKPIISQNSSKIIMQKKLTPKRSQISRSNQLALENKKTKKK
jgi:hypothetical protein